MIALIVALLAVAVTGPQLGHGWVTIAIDGDSNSYRSYFNLDSAWTDQLAWKMDTRTTYDVHSVAYGGKTVETMGDSASTCIDPYLSAPGICILMGGVNDITQGADSATTYQRIADFCTARQSAGWYMIVCTYPSGDQRTVMPKVNQGIVANWSSFADEIVRMDLDPNIGDGSPTADTTYWHDSGHFWAIGHTIVCDSVWKHVEPALDELRRL